MPHGELEPTACNVEPVAAPTAGRNAVACYKHPAAAVAAAACGASLRCIFFFLRWRRCRSGSAATAACCAAWPGGGAYPPRRPFVRRRLRFLRRLRWSSRRGCGAASSWWRRSNSLLASSGNAPESAGARWRLGRRPGQRRSRSSGGGQVEPRLVPCEGRCERCWWRRQCHRLGFLGAACIPYVLLRLRHPSAQLPPQQAVA